VGQLGALYAIWLREVKRALRDRGQLVGGLSRPILWVILLGIGLNPYFRGEVYGEARFVVPYTYLQFIFPAVIVLNILYTSVQSAVSVIWDREFGFLREILVSPMPRSLILLGKVLGGATVAMLHGALVLALARFADVSLAPQDIQGHCEPKGDAIQRSRAPDQMMGSRKQTLSRMLAAAPAERVCALAFAGRLIA
jgi:ABC-2 type transport system permease protein